MRIVTYRSDRGPRAGLLRDDSVVDVWDALGGERLERSRSARLRPPRGRGRDRRRASRCRSSAVELLPPVPDPREDRLHRAQLPGPRRRGGDRAARARRPSSPSSATRWRRRARPSPLPAASDKVDFEAEVAFVVGRRAKDVARPRRSTTSPATCCSTTSRPATFSSRPRSGCRARCSTARRPAARPW